MLLEIGQTEVAPPEAERSAFLRWIPATAGITVLLLLAAVVTGWAIDIRVLHGVVPGYVTVYVNTVVGLGVSAVSLVLHSAELNYGLRHRHGWERHAGRVLGALAAALGVATVAGYAFHHNLAIDQLLLSVPKAEALAAARGRMAITTAVGLVFLGASLLALGVETRRWHCAARWCAIAAGGIGMSALLVYVYRVIPVAGAGVGIPMAVVSTVSLALLAAGALACESYNGWMPTLTSLGAGGVLARRMLPLAFLVPLALGGVRASGVALGLDTQTADSALLAILTMFGFGFMIWRTAGILEQAERRWRSAEHDRSRLISEEGVARSRAQSEHEARLLAEQGRVTTELHAAELMSANAALAIANHAAENAREVAEATLWEQNALLTAMPDIVLVIDRDGTYLDTPGNTALLVGSPEDMLGRRMHDFLPLSVADTCVAAIHEALDTDRKVELEYSLDIRGRHVWFAGIVSPLSDRTVLWIARDITDRKIAEARLVQSQKLEAVGQLAGGIAHDFNNMLTVITAYASMLSSELPVDDPMRADVAEITAAADRAAALTRNILAFSRKQALEPHTLDLNKTVVGIEGMLRRVLPSDIELITKLDEGLGLVHADPGQLEQVLMNLVVNARDAMPDGGTLLIETVNTVLDFDTDPRSGRGRGNRYVSLTVSDDGQGMSKDVRERAFEPFFTTKEIGKGTGLGLSTAHGVIKQSGGHITVYSEPGLGTSVRILLPQMLNGAERRESAPVSSPEPERGTEIVLLVEDELPVRTVAQRILSQAGYTVLVAGNGREALEVFDQNILRIAIVVSDIIMPEMGGPEFVARVRARRPDLAVLYMSGYTEESVLRRGITDRPMMLLHKPFTPDTLIRKVREALRKSPPPDQLAPTWAAMA